MNAAVEVPQVQETSGGIDLVADGPFMNLMFQDDVWYTKFTKPHSKLKRVQDLVGQRERAGAELAALAVKRLNDPANYPYEYMVRYYSEAFGKIAVCDVGAHYGRTSMETASLLREIKADAKMYAFDAGIASQLTWRNFENNGFTDIDFRHAAVGPIDGHTVMYRQPGHAEDNAILREAGAISFPVRCVQLDTVLEEKGGYVPTLAKIDTQGAEPGVLAGMRKLIAAQPVTMVLEFTPCRVVLQMPPELFIDELLLTHAIFDLGSSRDRLRLVEDATAFTRDVWSRQFADILAVPRNLPGYEEVVDFFVQGEH
jgi:FkbM family methyltransferase